MCLFCYFSYGCVFGPCFFFFSSRRGHTRWNCDWSSDVCSSDLASLRGRPAPVIEGLTGDQRVFLGWAQVWREKIRDETLRQRPVSDPQSPARYRVNGVIRNVDGWYSAFQVQL